MFACRYLYNSALKQRIVAYSNQYRNSLNYYDQSKELAAAKKESDWLAAVPHHCLQQTLKDLQTAYDKFFKGLSKFPQFKKRNGHLSMRFPDPMQFSVSERKAKRTSFVKLPKIGILRFVSSQKIKGEIKNVTVSKTPSGEFYISFSCVIKEAVFTNFKSSVGIDRGINTFGMTSEAECLEIPNERIKLLELKLEKEQRKFSRKVKRSKNQEKQRIRVAKVYQKITNVRNDAIHKISHSLAKNHGLVVLEDLKVANMSASAKGTIAEPGRMVRQKSGLNRAILRQGWGEFERQLAYKCAWNGGKLIKVAPHFTSQTCSSCGHKDKENRKKESFVCLGCGHQDHSDVNAAKNILALGHSVSVCGEASVGILALAKVRRASKKQKPISA